jgi:hypothetical protein
MKAAFPQTMVRAVAMVAVAWAVVPDLAQAGPPTLSANPGKHVIFPAKGQTAEQQKQDESAAYEWATQQTGWDPYKEQEKLAGANQAAAATADAAKGGAVKGAAGGALVGVAVGAIAGDAGKGAAIGAVAGGLTGGMRSKRTQKTAQGTAEGAQAAYSQQFAIWDKNFMAAMEGKGYTVK